MTEHTTTCDLSVIIVNWNARAFLKPCLDSVLAAADGLSLEVWVVDNASDDGSVEMMRARYPQAHLIANTYNRGFAAANNQALAQAGGRHAILLNPDTETPPGTLAQMVRFLDEHPGVGVVGPQLALRRGKIQGGAAGYEPSPWTVFNYSFFLYKLAPRLFRGMWLAQRQYLGGAPIRVDWVSGAALMVRLAAAREVGQLDEDYFMYAEDVDFCRRLRGRGWTIYCLPDVQIIHHIGRSTRQRGPGFFAINVHSLDHYYRSHYASGIVRLLHLFGAGGFLLRAVAYETLHIVRGQAIYRELAEGWWVCTRTSLSHMLGQAHLPKTRTDADQPVQPVTATPVASPDRDGPRKGSQP